VIQRNAIKSWMLLHQDIEIILFGEEEGVTGVVDEFAIRYEPQVDRNEYGTPLVNSMFDRAQEIARYPIVCYVNCDVLLLNDFCDAVSMVAAWPTPFLMVGRRWDTHITELIDFSQPDWRERLRILALRTNRQRPGNWIDYFTFSRGLYYHKVPPFAIGRPGWDNWMVWFARSSGASVVDASRSVMAVHQNHDYSHHPLGYKGVWEGEEAKSNARLLGGWRHAYSTNNATHTLGPDGPHLNLRHWLVLGRRAVRVFWFALLRLTRSPARADPRSFGADGLPESVCRTARCRGVYPH
jgi:hypothetical protein